MLQSKCQIGAGALAAAPHADSSTLMTVRGLRQGLHMPVSVPYPWPTDTTIRVQYYSTNDNHLMGYLRKSEIMPYLSEDCVLCLSTATSFILMKLKYTFPLFKSQHGSVVLGGIVILCTSNSKAHCAHMCGWVWVVTNEASGLKVADE